MTNDTMTDDPLASPVPHDPHAERAILGAILTGHRQEGLDLIGPDFWLPTHERIWDACTRIAASRGNAPVAITVTKRRVTAKA